MTEAEARIREALAAGPTPGEWIAELGEAYVVRSQADGGRVAICTNLRGFHGMGGRRDGDEVAANARLIAACNPVNVAALLAERDALAKDAERYRWLRGDLCPDHAVRWAQWEVRCWRAPCWTGDLRREELDGAIDAALAQAKDAEARG